MKTKPYVFFDGGRWYLRWTRPDWPTQTVSAGSFDRACQMAGYLVERHGLVVA